MSKKEKLLKLLRKELDSSDRKLLDIFSIVEQRDLIVFRMPVSFFSLDALWGNICSISNKSGYKVLRTDLYPTVEELDGILSDIEWLWPGNIPKGFMTLLAGEPGIGKSLVALDWARAVTCGSMFPMAKEKSVKSSVLWIDTEMKQQLLNIRSKSLGLDRSKMYIPAINGNLLTKFDASVEDNKQHVVNIVEDKHPTLMVLDSLGHSHSRGENRIEEVRPVMDFFTSLARDYSMAVVVVHHLNKGSPQETSEISLARVRGSTDIVATPVVIFSIEKGIEDSIKIRQIKNNIGKQQPTLSVKLQYNDSEKEEVSSLLYSLYTPPPAKRTKKEMCADWIYDKIHNNGNEMPLAKLIEMGKEEGFTRDNIYMSRENLGERITYTGNGRMAVWQIARLPDSDAIQAIRTNGSKKEKK